MGGLIKAETRFPSIKITLEDVADAAELSFINLYDAFMPNHQGSDVTIFFTEDAYITTTLLPSNIFLQDENVSRPIIRLRIGEEETYQALIQYKTDYQGEVGYQLLNVTEALRLRNLDL